MTTNSPQVSSRIQGSLTAKKLSVAWLVRETGIAEKTLRRHLKAPDGFKLWELSAISRAIDVPLEDLVRADVDEKTCQQKLARAA